MIWFVFRMQFVIGWKCCAAVLTCGKGYYGMDTLAEISKTLDEEKKMFTEAFTKDTDWGYTTKFEECQNPIIAPVNWPLKYLICKTYFDLNMRPSLEKKLSVKSFLK